MPDDKIVHIPEVDFPSELAEEAIEAGKTISRITEGLEKLTNSLSIRFNLSKETAYIHYPKVGFDHTVGYRQVMNFLATSYDKIGAEIKSGEAWRLLNSVSGLTASSNLTIIYTASLTGAPYRIQAEYDGGKDHKKLNVTKVLNKGYDYNAPSDVSKKIKGEDDDLFMEAVEEAESQLD